MLASGNLRADNLLFDSPDAKPDAISLDWSLDWSLGWSLACRSLGCAR